jgi:beta-barrel assembly-enhancing protease
METKDSGAATNLRNQLPAPHENSMADLLTDWKGSGMKFIKRLMFSLLASLLIITMAAASGNEKPLKKKENPDLIGKRDINKRHINIYSLEREVELGKRLAAELEKRSELVNDTVVQELVNRVTQNIVINSDSKTPVTVKVINSAEINAFSLPGGFLYVNRGLIEAADNEAELAGVIAHEVAHIAARHGSEDASRKDLINWASLLLFISGSGSGSINRAAKVLSFKFSRSSEKEADQLAAQYLWKAGYDPQALLTFLEKLGAQEQKTRIPLRNLFRTHPVSQDRIQDTGNLLARFPKKNEYQVDSSDFISVKGRPGIARYEWERAEPKKKKKRRLPNIKIPPIKPPIF